MNSLQSSAPPATHNEIRLVAHAEGTLTTEHFDLTESPVPEPGPDQVLVRNRTMAVSTAMRTRATTTELPVSTYVPGEPLWGPAIGEVVIAPADTDLAVGDLVRHSHGWREYAVVDTARARWLDPNVLPEPATFLSRGATAWAALTRTVGIRPGETVFVTGAAGGVGSMAGQIARLLGAGRVIGSTGSDGKGRYLREKLGHDGVVSRSAGNFEQQLRRAAPEGVDVVFDTVGGEQLRAAITTARSGARVVLVGALSGQLGGDGLSSPVELDSSVLITRRITVHGFSLVDHPDAEEEWNHRFGTGLRDGTLIFPHTRLHGLDRAPGALCELAEGRHTGTVLVDL
ncbi:MDR family NADP-dependent oxidoreductase [Actinopolyspora halophila]|uniref:MDR family NADP-dependent oxidoreductase n=1 Tax=Actinopolyspora halophila TaxID=1850 RepID=UPI0004774435|nr:NADP-dependent oxidoreductase [Actinopolyspora halophila]